MWVPGCMGVRVDGRSVVVARGMGPGQCFDGFPFVFKAFSGNTIILSKCGVQGVPRNTKKWSLAKPPTKPHGQCQNGQKSWFSGFRENGRKVGQKVVQKRGFR